MTTPKLKFSHKELTDAGFGKYVENPYDDIYIHPDGRAVYACDGEDLNSDGDPIFVDSLNDLKRSCPSDCTRLATANATIARLTEERDKLLEACQRIVEGNLGDAAWQGNYERIREVCREAIALVKGGGK